MSTPDDFAPAPEPVKKNTVTFNRTHLYAVLLPLAFVAGLAVGFLFWGRAAEQKTVAAGAQAVIDPIGQPTQDPKQIKRYTVTEDNNPSLGPASAAITIIEFSDYQCPFCTKFHKEIWPQIKAAYGDQIRLVYRDFPLISIHDNAVSAAEAADCALEQNKYWEFHDALFSDKYSLGKDNYIQYATELKLDVTAFTTCIDSRKFQSEVNADYTYASNLGVSSTPTFFLNGIPLVGAQPFTVWKGLIDKELAGELPK